MIGEHWPIDLPPMAAIPHGYRTIDELQAGGELEEKVGRTVVVGSVAAMAVSAAVNALRRRNKDTPLAIVTGLVGLAAGVATALEGRTRQDQAAQLREHEANGVEIVTDY